MPAPPPPTAALYELRDPDDPRRFAGAPLTGVGPATARLRAALAARLAEAAPELAGAVERAVIGRSAGGEPVPNGERVALVLLPSVGHAHTQPDARRLWVEVPAGCPVPVEDLRWALSGLCFKAGPGRSARLVPADAADGDGFLQHYGADAPGLVWQTVTPVALAGDGADLSGRVAAALRHAGLPAGLRGLRAQREPFHAKGRPAGDFAEGTRFPAAGLWHLELELSRPVRGPLRLGDGRHLGLGLLRPAPAEGGLYALEVVGGLAAGADPTGLARALRAAVMARVQAVLGPRAALPAYLHGHEPEAGPRRGHLHFVWDPPRQRLLLVAPHRAERRGASAAERAQLHTLERALEGFTELRAGGAGLLQLRPAAVDAESEPLLGRSPMWASVTPYRVDRHRPAGSAADALVADVQASLAAAGLPRAEVEVRQVRARPGVGLEGELSVIFAAAVEGPLLLGRSRHLGGGLFERQG